MRVQGQDSLISCRTANSEGFAQEIVAQMQNADMLIAMEAGIRYRRTSLRAQHISKARTVENCPGKEVWSASVVMSLHNCEPPKSWFLGTLLCDNHASLSTSKPSPKLLQCQRASDSKLGIYRMSGCCAMTMRQSLHSPKGYHSTATPVLGEPQPVQGRAR